MKRIIARLTTFLLILVFAGIAAGCNLRSTPTAPALSTEAIFTQAAQTIIAGLTQAAPVATQTSTPPPATDLPAATQPPTATETPLPVTTPTVVETAAVTPTVTQAEAEVLFEEDFERGTGWHTEENSGFGFEFVDGGYRIYVNIVNAAIWSIRETDETDMRLEVDASRTGGPESGYSGLVCRHQDDDNYYALVISTDGSYGIAKNEDGEFEFIQEGTAQAGVIRGGDEVNRIRADCVDDVLTLYANGQRLVEVQDDDFTSGDVGLVAGTRGQEGVEVLFDNFAIMRP